MRERELADLERFQPQGSDYNPDVPQEVVTQLRISLARIEGKLDGVINLNAIVTKLAERVTDAETRITKLEQWQGFAVWAFGAAQSVVLVVVAAVLAYYWHH